MKHIRICTPLIAMTLVLPQLLWATPPTFPILGGERETVEQAVVLVRVRSPELSGSCSGSLVSPSLVLTAAHCLKSSSAESYTVKVGETSYGVSYFFSHPGYAPLTSHDDDEEPSETENLRS